MISISIGKARIERTLTDLVKRGYIPGTAYSKRRWIGAGNSVPGIGTDVMVIYDGEKPSKGKIVCRWNARRNNRRSK